VLIAMAGLPGTGKSTLARTLAEDLRRDGIEAIVLDKDETRAALFERSAIEYSAEQDNLVVDIMLQVAAFHLSRHPKRVVLLDGRTFARAAYVTHVVEVADRLSTRLTFIECRCADATALQRLVEDQAQSRHVAANRTAALYLKLKAEAEPMDIPHLVVDTDAPLASIVRQCRTYLAIGCPEATEW
jgi:predicted kinase